MSTIYKLILPLFVFILIGCADEKKASDTADSTTTTTTTTTTPQVTTSSGNQPSSMINNIQFPDGQSPQAAAQPAQRKPEPLQNADGVWHYTCPKGCEGGGAKGANCKACGAALGHNQAYHANNGQQAQPNIVTNNSGGAGSPIQINPGQGQGTTPIMQPPSGLKEPAQNAAGVWHFTCPKGCAGGAGAKGPCAGCGGELAHNQGYH